MSKPDFVNRFQLSRNDFVTRIEFHEDVPGQPPNAGPAIVMANADADELAKMLNLIKEQVAAKKEVKQ